MQAGSYSCQRPATDWTGILVLFPFFFLLVSFLRQEGTKVLYFHLYRFCVSRQVFGFLE